MILDTRNGDEVPGITDPSDTLEIRARDGTLLLSGQFKPVAGK